MVFCCFVPTKTVHRYTEVCQPLNKFKFEKIDRQAENLKFENMQGDVGN